MSKTWAHYCGGGPDAYDHGRYVDLPNGINCGSCGITYTHAESVAVYPVEPALRPQPDAATVTFASARLTVVTLDVGFEEVTRNLVIGAADAPSRDWFVLGENRTRILMILARWLDENAGRKFTPNRDEGLVAMQIEEWIGAQCMSDFVAGRGRWSDVKVSVRAVAS